MKTIPEHRRDSTFRPDRHAGPEPESGVPDPVRGDLSELDLNYRAQYAKLLSDNGAISIADGMCLDLMATLSSDIENVTRIIREADYMAPGGKSKHPALASLNSAQAHLIQLLKEFGLTPRGRVGLDTGFAEPDPLMEMLAENLREDMEREQRRG